jgi:hypothetical protein
MGPIVWTKECDKRKEVVESFLRYGLDDDDNVKEMRTLTRLGTQAAVNGGSECQHIIVH